MIGSWADVEEALRRLRGREGAVSVSGEAGLPGRDGKDGKDGRDGRDGVDGTGGGGVNDHGELTGLEDDDHPQYLTGARGDARYVPQSGVADTIDSRVRALLQAGANVRLSYPSGAIVIAAEGGGAALVPDYRQNVRTVPGGTYAVQSDDEVLIVLTSNVLQPETAVS